MKEQEKQSFIQSKPKKTETIINEVGNHLQFGYLETSVNRCYYCCFYCGQALLSKLDLYPKTHKGVITLFNLHYVKTEIFPMQLGDFFREIFAQRQLVDYGEVHEMINQAMVEDFLKNTGLFFEKTKELLQKA